MTGRALLLSLCVLTTTLAGCAEDAPGPTTSAPATTDTCASVARTSLNLSNPNHTAVALNTDHGCIVAELYETKTPITTANFKKLVGDGFYTDMLFHRIMKNFMVQTGGMKKDGEFKESPYPPIKNEARTSGLKNLEYTLSMARTTQPDSATNQFFINTNNNANLDPNSQSAGYAVFGIVVQGRPVVDQIENTPVTYSGAAGANPHCQGGDSPSSPHCPTRDVVLRSATIL